MNDTEFLQKIKKIFEDVKDYRNPSYVKHKLADVLSMIAIAMLVGKDSLGDIHSYLVDKKDKLDNFLEVKKVPSKATLSRMLQCISLDEIRDAVSEIGNLSDDQIGTHFAVDGKAIRSTVKEGSSQAEVQCLTILDTKTKKVVAEEFVDRKTNEIPVLQSMLENWKLQGITITGDALHCQTKTCKIILYQGGDYLFSLKANQRELLEMVKLYFEDPNTSDQWEKYSTETEKAHGRIEKRECYKLTNIEWLKEQKNWPGVKAVGVIKTYRETKKKHTEETSYFITSLDKSAEELLNIKRLHWSIESIHWTMDVTFNEDKCRLKTQNAHLILNSLRKLSIFFHRTVLRKMNSLFSIRRNIQKCERDDEYFLKTMSVFI